MTQDERWLARYNEVIGFLEENHRNPSRHRIEEHDMLNWLKANRKMMNAGKMKEFWNYGITESRRYGTTLGGDILSGVVSLYRGGEAERAYISHIH